MIEPLTGLIDELNEDLRAILYGAELDLHAKYGDAIRDVGAVPFFAEVFRRLGDATLSRLMTHLTHVWKDLPYESWKEILYRISGDTGAVYQFIWFACEYLALDAVRLIREDPAVDQTARGVADFDFPRGCPQSGSEWIREVLEDHGVDPQQLWRRLADEGAPMRSGLTPDS
jgi:hypothetical protein